MTRPVLLLVLIGVAAAFCAAFLIARIDSLSAQTAGSAIQYAGEVDVLVASRDLAPMSLIKSGDVVKKKVPVDQVPPERLANEVQVVGQVLCAPMSEGQPFLEGHIARNDAGVHLASILDKDKAMRAVSLSLKDHSAMVGLLYPGSVVDVLISFRKPKEGGGFDIPVSATLLQGVQVLAVENQTVAAAADENNYNPGRGQDRRMVTLMVTSAEAQALQLAQQYGKLSLTMRNPLDAKQTPARVISLDQLGSGEWRSAGMGVAPPPTTERLATHQQPAAAEVVKSAPMWDVVVIRGGEARTQQMPAPKNKSDQ